MARSARPPPRRRRRGGRRAARGAWRRSPRRGRGRRRGSPPARGPESALPGPCGIGQVGGVEARRDDESPPCLPIGGLAGLADGQEEQDATLVKPEAPRRVCVRHDDPFHESSPGIVAVASYALILAPRHQPLPCGPVVGDGRPGVTFVNQVASRLRGKRIQIAHHDFPSMLAITTSPAWRPSSRHARLAGALDLPGRALLPGLRITYDLAFDRILHHARCFPLGGESYRLRRPEPYATDRLWAGPTVGKIPYRGKGNPLPGAGKHCLPGEGNKSLPYQGKTA